MVRTIAEPERAISEGYSQPMPSWSRSRSKTSGPTTVTRPVYSGPFPDPPLQS